MRIITKALALGALLAALAVPATVAHAQSCAGDPYCSSDTPDVGGSDHGTPTPTTVGGGTTGGGTTGGGTTGGGTTGGGTTGDDGGSVLPSDDEVTTGGGAGAEPEVAPAAAAVETPRSGPSGTLPFTGADVVELTVAGIAAVALGTVLVRRSRAARAAV